MGAVFGVGAIAGAAAADKDTAVGPVEDVRAVVGKVAVSGEEMATDDGAVAGEEMVAREDAAAVEDVVAGEDAVASEEMVASGDAVAVEQAGKRRLQVKTQW